MTTTPAVWKDSFQPNAAAPQGHQSLSQTVGLSNGNILVMWEDNTQGPGPFTDIMGRLYSAEGRPLGEMFQVNSSVTGSDETGPKAVALPDGGYVVAYGGYFDATGGFINVERFDSAGNSVFSSQILDERSSLTAWEIAADGAGNYTVAYERYDDIQASTDPEYSINIYTTTYDYLTNAASLENLEAAQNSRDEDDRLGAIATFADGVLITLYDELDRSAVFDFPLRSIEFTITDPRTGAIIRDATEIRESPEDEFGRALDVAVLAGSQFVMLYSICPVKDTLTGFHFADQRLMMKIGSSEGAIGAEIRIDNGFGYGGLDHADDFARGFENARVVALGDGGFMVVWLRAQVGDPSLLIATRFSASGVQIGDQIVVSSDVTDNDNMLGHLGLTADGRVLITYLDAAHEVREVILDPRDNAIFGTAAGEVITTQVTDTQIFGLGGADTILGQGGDDVIDGGAGFDTLHGGRGSDTFYLYDATLNGDFDLVVEAADGGRDTVHVSADALDPNILYNYVLTENVENGLVAGFAGVDLVGNSLANRLTGNAATNFFFGLGGNDTLNGGAGVDTLFGGDGSDTYLLTDTAGTPGFLSYDTVVENPGAGLDTVRVNSAVLSAGGYVLPDNVENGAITGGAVFDLRGNDLGNQLAGNSAQNTLTGLSGNDVLEGAGGADRLLGGAGQDRYVFAALKDSGTAKGLWDIIANFTAGDVIDVRQIDADSTLAGNQAFVLDGNGVLRAGEVSFEISGAFLLISFNTDADADPEMQILLGGRTSVSAADFVL